MGLPGPALLVEGLEGFGADPHSSEAPHPDEAIRIVQISELPDDVHPRGLQALPELPVEQIDQRLPSAPAEGLLPQLDHRTAVDSRRSGGSARCGAVHGASCGPTRSEATSPPQPNYTP